MSKIHKADVIIVRAGIIGASCAFRLSDQGLKAQSEDIDSLRIDRLFSNQLQKEHNIV